LTLDPGHLCKGLEVGDDKRPQEQQEESDAREISSIFAADAPKGRLLNAEEGFPQRFPLSRRGFRSFTPFCTHTHRMWGSMYSSGTAADRGRRKGGGRTGSTGLQMG
jgi:hypothetical protein